MWFKKFKEWIEYDLVLWILRILDFIIPLIFILFAIFLSFFAWKITSKYSTPSFYERLTSIDENISKCVQILEKKE